MTTTAATATAAGLDGADPATLVRYARAGFAEMSISNKRSPLVTRVMVAARRRGALGLDKALRTEKAARVELHTLLRSPDLTASDAAWASEALLNAMRVTDAAAELATR